jgi:hypothetical protein
MKGSITQRSPGSWTMRFDLGVGPDGKRKQKRVTFRGTKAEVDREFRRMLHELDSGGFVEPAKLTLSAYLDRWLADYARTNVCGKTYERYEQIVEKNLKPALGQHPLPKLQPLHIQAFYSEAVTSGGARTANRAASRPPPSSSSIGSSARRCNRP